MLTDLRVGIIGTGVMGADHARNLARGVRGVVLTAIADADAARANALAQEAGGAIIYPSGEEMIVSGQVDAVIIAVPDPLHAPLTRACFEIDLLEL